MVALSSGSTGPSELPSELIKQVERRLKLHKSVSSPRDVLEDDLLEILHEYAGRAIEWERANVDVPIAPASRWQERAAQYALMVSERYDQAEGLVEHVFASTQWRLATGRVRAQLRKAAVAGPDALEAMASTGWLAASRGVLPVEVRESVRSAEPGTRVSMIDLIESDREGEFSRVGDLITAVGHSGCTSPAVRLIRLRLDEGRPGAARSIAAFINPEELAAKGEFGAITHMAAELCADGADDEALKWSSCVDDTRLFHETEDHGTWLARQQVRRSPSHRRAWCVRLCDSADARLLGALALIDWTGGLEARALDRAERCDAGEDTFGWSASGVQLLADWVLTRNLPSAQRRVALDQLVEQSGRSHVDLGLLGVQFHSELAELAAVVGRSGLVAQHRGRAEWFVSHPTMRLHFEEFQFPSLLSRLPLAATPSPEH